MEEIAKMSDNGTPFVVALPETLDIVQTYTELAKKVDEEIKNKDDYDISINYDPKIGKIVCDFSEDNKK